MIISGSVIIMGFTARFHRQCSFSLQGPRNSQSPQISWSKNLQCSNCNTGKFGCTEPTPYQVGDSLHLLNLYYLLSCLIGFDFNCRKLNYQLYTKPGGSGLQSHKYSIYFLTKYFDVIGSIVSLSKRGSSRTLLNDYFYQSLKSSLGLVSTDLH